MGDSRREQAEQATRQAVAALQRGEAAVAKRLLEEVVAQGDLPTPPWFLLAQACRHAGDETGERRALDAVLEAEPRHVAALIMRGDGHVRDGDHRAGSAFYQAALAAAPPPDRCSRLLAGELRRARQAIADHSDIFAAHLQSRLADDGVTAIGRVGDAVDILLGRKSVYLQQPTSFYFPGLPQIAFYERQDFPWLEQVEAATAEIRAELQAVVADQLSFGPYVESDPNRPPKTSPLLGDASWSAFHLYQRGTPHPDNAARCPRTMAALRHAPLPVIRGRSPMALFSMLRPGAHIMAHNGLLNTRLICHLPLIVPPDCTLRVGNALRAWRTGEALVFDDSIEHEAWNRSAETRIVLLFEIWRPEISDEERIALTALFEAITDYGGIGADHEG